MKVFKIVLTGGPCSGKTTVLKKVRDYLSKKEDSHVIVIPETATLLLSNGIKIKPDKEGVAVFQDIVYLMQKTKELAVQKSLDNCDNESIFIIHDRGIIDNKAYLESQNDFDTILSNYGDCELKIIDNYDLIIDLISASNRSDLNYGTANNEIRFEDAETAKKVDLKTSQAWLLHRNLKVVDTTDTIEEKIEQVIQLIENLISCQNSYYPLRFILDKKTNLEVFNDDNSKCIDLECYDLNLSNQEIKYYLEKRTYKNAESCVLKVVKLKDEQEIVIKNEVLSQEDFNRFFNQYKPTKVIRKKVIHFILNKQLYNIYVYDNSIILELEKNTMDLDLPSINLPIEKKITNVEFYNIEDELANGNSLSLK